MRITRIRLAHYRGIDQLEVNLPRRGLCILLGENEVGKTSMVEAIDLLLDYPHDSRHAAVLAVKPVHRDVGTEVEADFEAGETRFTYRKRFHVLPRTELMVHAPRHENRTGREAHDRVAALLRCSVDLDLWRALRVRQGSIGEQPSLAGAPSLARALAQDAQQHAREHADLIAAARREYERWFTPRGERRRALVDHEAEVARLREHAAALARAVVEVEADADRCAELELTLAQARAAQARVREATAAATRERDAARAHAQALELARESVAAAEPALERSESVLRLHRERARLEQSLAGSRASAERAREVHAAACAALHDAQTRLDASVTRRDAAHRAAALEVRRDKLAACASALAHLQEAHAQLAAMPALEASEVEHLVRLAAVAAAAHARLSAQSASLRLRARRDVRLDGTGPDGAWSLELAAGEEREIVVPAQVSVESPELAIEVRSGRAGEDLAAAARTADAELAAALQRLGVADVDAARSLLAERRERQRAARELEAMLARLLPGQAPASFAAAIERLAAEARPEAATFDPGELAASEAEHALASLAQRNAQRAADAARTEAERTATAMAALQARIQAAGMALAGLAEADAPSGSLADAERTLEARAGHFAAARRRLAALEAVPMRAVAAIDAECERLAQQSRESEATAEHARDQLTALRTRLEVRGEEGLADQLGLAQRDLQCAADALAIRLRRASAARALFEALVQARDACVHAYHVPIAQGVETLGRAVFGPTFRVTLDEQLQVTHRTKDGVTVPFRDLSLGAREQIAILLRLACAMAVAPLGGVPVWLDDALGQTDPERLTGMGHALRLAAERCQVVLLTCSPQRARLPGAHVVRVGRGSGSEEREAVG